MASYAYCHHVTEKKHLKVPSKRSTSINDVGAPEDGNLLNQIPKKKHYKNCEFKKDFGYDEQYDVISGPYKNDNVVNKEQNIQLKYSTRLKYEHENESMLGGIYRPGKECPKPYKVGKKPFHKHDYLHSNGTGSKHDSTRYLKRQNIKIPEDAAGLKSNKFKKSKDEPNRRFPEKWWELQDKELLIHKVAQHQRWFHSPLIDESVVGADQLNPSQEKKANTLLDEENETLRIKKSIKTIVHNDVKVTGRGFGEYTNKLRHNRENHIYHVQNLPGFKPGIHTVDDPSNPHANKDTMKMYPAERMHHHHLKPTTGMLAWS